MGYEEKDELRKCKFMKENKEDMEDWHGGL